MEDDMDTLTPTSVRYLDSGYWLVWFGPQRFVQFRAGDVPTIADAFGDQKEALCRAAQQAVEALINGERNTEDGPYRRRDDLLTPGLLRVYQRGHNEACIARIPE